MNGKISVEAIGATELLRGDHRRLKELFRDFESVDRETKNYIARTAIEEIELHTLLEEKIFYPTVREEVVDSEEIIAESEEAHHFAKLLITELKVIPYGDRYHAKFERLTETLLNHIRQEEEKLFPMVEKSNVDLEQLGLEMTHLKMRAVSRRGLARPGTAGKTAAVILLGALAAVVIGLFIRSPQRV